jgi:hypothetical protein
MMNKNYKPGAAKAAPAKKVAPKKVITCVKGKVTKKVTNASCPSGYKRK